jgi:hypothetical protein
MSGFDFEYAIKKDVRNNPIVREVDEARQRQLWRTAGIGAVLVGVLLFSAWQHFELVRHGYVIQRLRRRKSIVISSSRSSRSVRRSASSPLPYKNST